MGIINVELRNEAERKLMVELGPWKPVVVTLDAQEIGKLYASKATPYMFAQYLLQRFKEEGVPVEGTLDLKLAHGKTYKMKTSPRGRGFFDYIWLPEAYDHAIQGMGGVI